ncbi:MAG: hypothetical protein IJL02_10355 [Methanobrevibacter sp.]|uniref:hypothetical protein n=1 Tax=Methanobrevibacter sp. TaxID=66852 RepID=UPI0025CFF96B|nr:hypothetical protein [Methanobrevibacter sp.]MBQ6100245.1 hypothetical protein [Methanobrevibacter sp.]
MSELSELIEINKNIEKQNEEIIRLLKKIAGEDGYVHMEKEEVVFDEIEDTDLLKTAPDVGEVYFVDNGDVFKLTVEDNETSVDNLTGSAEPSDYSVQELIANETIKRNQPLAENIVILGVENSANLPQILKVCHEQGAEKVYIPWYEMKQLIGAPETLMQIIKLDFYKTEELLIEKLF